MNSKFLVFIVVLCVELSLGDVLTYEAKKACLDEHNHYRRLLATGQVKNMAGDLLPTATNMNKLTYSAELEGTAEKWAQTCKTTTRTPKDQRGSIGQNICWFMPGEGQIEAIKKCTQKWWDDVKQYPGTDVVFKADIFSKDVGQFTQMAWAKNSKVGCATKMCSGGTFVVCNYESGNHLDTSIYNTGKTCSACEDTKRCKDSLCVSCIKKPARLSRAENSAKNLKASNGSKNVQNLKASSGSKNVQNLKAAKRSKH